MIPFIHEVLLPRVSTITPAEFRYIYRRIHKLTFEEQYFLFKNVPKSVLPHHVRVTDNYLYFYQGVREPNPGTRPVLYTIYSPQPIPESELSTFTYTIASPAMYGPNTGGNFYQIHSDSHYTPPSSPPAN